MLLTLFMFYVLLQRDYASGVGTGGARGPVAPPTMGSLMNQFYRSICEEWLPVQHFPPSGPPTLSIVPTPLYAS